MPAKKVVKRYSESERSDIIKFIEQFNAEKGRGGATAAIKKFGVTAATLSAWTKKSGKKAKKAGKAGKKTRNPSKLWERLTLVKSEIAKAEKALAKLNNEAKLLRKEIRSAID